MIQELDELSDSERANLKSSIDDILNETPKTLLAVTRFKKAISKLGKDMGNALYKVLVDVASETVKKIIEAK